MLNSGKAKLVADEIRAIAEELPQYRLIFLAPTGKDALLKFSTWIMSLLNFIDSDEGSLVYAMPTLLIDIPFDIFRALKRTNQDLYDSHANWYDGCLQGKTFQ